MHKKLLAVLILVTVTGILLAAGANFSLNQNPSVQSQTDENLDALAIDLDSVEFTSGGNTTAARLRDYWRGDAEWQLDQRLVINNLAEWSENPVYDEIRGFEAGVHFVHANNELYMFGRKVYAGQRCDFIDAAGRSASYGEKLGTVVRKFNKQTGQWSKAVDVLKPTPGTEWECAATDGDVYFDQESNTWHFLFQCIKPAGAWSGCYARRNNIDPVGEFNPINNNPVIKAGALWSQMCRDRSGACFRTTGGSIIDEGTFDIIDKVDGWYYVAMHGYNPSNQYGVRGIAKTQNFRQFVAGDSAQGVPTDAILTREDAANWIENWQRGGNIGFGAGSTLKEGGFYYMLAEAADISLTCVPGQNWNIGIFRSNSLANTKWSQPTAFNNPILYSGKETRLDGSAPTPCNPAYTGLFRDPATGEIYMHSSRLSDNHDFQGIFIYKLVKKNNLLTNGDFWRCRPRHWQSFVDGRNNVNAVNFEVLRNISETTDANCLAKINCENGCTSGQGVYQDYTMQFPQDREITVKFGGKIKVNSVRSDSLVRVAMFQLASDGSIVTVDEMRANMNNTNWQSLESTPITLRPRARNLRLQVYVEGINTYSLEEMFIDRQ